MMLKAGCASLSRPTGYGLYKIAWEKIMSFIKINLTENLHHAMHVGNRKSQTRRKAGAESHGSHGDSRVAWKGKPVYLFIISLIIVFRNL
jgi:hypothetical protein